MFGVSHGFELLIILGIVVVIFGVGKFGDIGGALGKSIREFRHETSKPSDSDDPASPSSSS